MRVEADAVTALLAAVEAGKVELATSAALRAESSRISNQSRRAFTERILALAVHEAPASAQMKVQVRIEAYQQAGIRPFDALHLASAVALRADYFCTTDDRLLRKARTANTEATRVVDPLELADALDL